MNRSVEQALTSLIPRHNGPLPPELIDLASSLLAQSRNKASNLKAEEEIGRTYACANIACERLKATLNLPTITPRPPCPPRVYNKLYAYFLTALQPQKRTRSQPASTNTTPQKISNQPKALPSRPTPTKERSLAAFKPTSALTSSRGKRSGLQYAVPTDISPWIHPVIRRLCKEMDALVAIPSVLAGVTSILKLPSPLETERIHGTESNKLAYKAPALIAAVWFFVKTRLEGKEVDGKTYAAQRRQVLGALEAARMDEDFIEGIRRKSQSNDTIPHSEWNEWEAIKSKDVDTWLTEISSKGWLELDWYQNVVEGAGLGGEDDAVEADDDPASSEREDKRRKTDVDVLQAGLGTMMSDRVDYLSEKRRAEYAIWKAGILARIEQLSGAREAVEADI